ncbi:MAG: molybdenum ABC transporter ATP-binding protein [Myxococcales bacterium]|nr:molybdenum ABC transporter ATP-binding protein [Myxococcales bacterium]
MKWQAVLQMQLCSLSLDVSLQGDEKPTALIGPNGSGKTTVLRALAGAHKPSAGHIRLGERVLFDGEQDVWLAPEIRGMGYVPQGYALFPHLNVLDNVSFGLRAQQPNTPSNQRRQSALSLLKKLQCDHLASRWPKALSGGEKQRVALARALMVQPDFLLLDEPLSALDATVRRQLRSYLSEMLITNTTPSLIVTQDAKDIQALNASIYVMQSGRIVQQGTIEEVKAEPANDFVAEFFNI